MLQPDRSRPDLWKVLTCILFLGIPSFSLATHNLAGQITLERNDPNNPNSYTITLTTYSDPSEANVDRCSADIRIYSANNLSTIAELLDVPRSNGPTAPVNFPDCDVPNTRLGEEVRGAIKRNIYRVDYIFPGPGEYYLHYSDIARLSNVDNICSSNEKAFTVVTRFLYNPILGPNSSPEFLNEPIYDACAGKSWSHNPGGRDIDGDSLVYYLVPSEDFDDTQAFNPQTNPRPRCYTFPDDVSVFPSNGPLVQDSLTGLITWEVPNQVGVYNISYVVEEYRNGLFLGFVQRDMAVFVNPCDNNPPVIETITDTCIFAGEILEFPFLAYDPDSTDSLYLRLNNGALGNNGPFSLTPPATIDGFIIDPSIGQVRRINGLPDSTANNNRTPVDTIKGTVTWQTSCDMIRSQIYQVDFFANDNFEYSDDDNNLTTLTDNKTVQIRVVPPPPEELTVEKGPRSISLSWLPTGCTDLVLGYFIYRKIDGNEFDQDTVCCEVSPADAGFELIQINEGWDNITFIDSLNDVEGGYGDQICYAITAIYGDPIQPQVPKLESCAESGCVEIENSEIFMTNDSVTFTDGVNGRIFVAWSEPDIDTLFPRPYIYRLYRANNNSFPAIEIAQLPFGTNSLEDDGLDTEVRNYNYRVEVFDATGQPINLNVDKHIASSIFLTTQGGTMQDIFLEWTETVSWQNDLYYIYRSENGGAFALVDSVAGTGANIHSYRDTDLLTDIEYCYFIRSRGSHGVFGIKDPLFNDSQQTCDFAVDDDPPCNPDLSLSNQCSNELAELFLSKSDLDCDADAAFVNIYYKLSPEAQFQQILQIPYSSFGRDTTFENLFPGQGDDLVGCFAVTVTDSSGNESEPSVESCVDFCPKLILTNVFTPNQDGTNDNWRPIEARDVRLVEVQIFDRWGRLMSRGNGSFDNMWDGISLSGNEAREGVYYYVLKYEELGISSNVFKETRGVLSLLR
ncbi:MAG: gliding motility-associated C-terminal domain-containing protein [Bacteroidia bacterium]|nr:gliding motility-associated C-terminal domain-containing protein [Bacteroidia bacterium]